MPTRSAIVRVGLGLLLLATAGLKLYGLGTPSAPRSGWFGQSWVQLLTAEWELVLGAWLLSGIAPRWSWLAALVTFVAFAGVSAYLATVGVASCGCLGAVMANPWWTLGVDVVAVALLAVSRPASTVSDSDTFARSASMWASSVALTCAALVAISTLIFGSVEASVAKLRGDSLFQLKTEERTVQPNEVIETPVIVRNCSDHPIQLLGFRNTCTCLISSTLPTTVPPNGEIVLRIQHRIIELSQGFHSRSFVVWTDQRNQPVLELQVAYRIR